jgi:hypothetical protein
MSRSVAPQTEKEETSNAWGVVQEWQVTINGDRNVLKLDYGEICNILYSVTKIH